MTSSLNEHYSKYWYGSRNDQHLISQACRCCFAQTCLFSSSPCSSITLHLSSVSQYNQCISPPSHGVNQSYDPLCMTMSSSSAPFRSECNMATTANVRAILSSCIKNAESQHLPDQIPGSDGTSTLYVSMTPFLCLMFAITFRVHLNGSSLCVNFTMNSYRYTDWSWKHSEELTADNSLLTGWNWPRRWITAAQVCRKNRNEIHPLRLWNWQGCLLEWSSGRRVWKKVSQHTFSLWSSCPVRQEPRRALTPAKAPRQITCETASSLHSKNGVHSRLQ